MTMTITNHVRRIGRTKKQVAKHIGLTPEGLRNKLKNGQFYLSEIRCLAMLFEITNDETIKAIENERNPS